MNDSTKKAVLGLSAAVGIGLAASGIVWGYEQSQNFVAKVDGTSVSKTEFEKVYDQQRKQYASRFGIDFASAQGAQVEADMKKGIVDSLIERQIIRNEVAKRGLKVEDAKLDEKLAEIKKGFPDEAAFEKALVDNGMKLADLREQIRDGLMVEALVADVTKGEAVKPGEAKAYYDKNQAMYQKPEEASARHILVKDEKLAKDLLAKLKGGADFAALAKEHSEDPGSKETGGDLGSFGRGRMVPEFEKAAFGLAKGQLSGLVKTQFGYHILQGGGRTAPRTQPFSEVEKEIAERLDKESKQAVFGKWLNEQKTKVKVEYKTGFAPAPAAAPGGVKIGEPGSGAAPAGESHDGHNHAPGEGH